MTPGSYRLIFFTVPVTVLLLWLAVGSYNRNQRTEHHEAVLQVAQALAIGARLYSEEHQLQLPPADHWEEALRPYLGTVPLTLPQTASSHGRRFAMNRAVAGHKLSDIAEPSSTILFYESVSAAANVTDDFNTLVPRDDPDTPVLVYVDGHVEDSYPSSARDMLIQRSRDSLKVKNVAK